MYRNVWKCMPVALLLSCHAYVVPCVPTRPGNMSCDTGCSAWHPYTRIPVCFETSVTEMTAQNWLTGMDIIESETCDLFQDPVICDDCPECIRLQEVGLDDGGDLGSARWNFDDDTCMVYNASATIVLGDAWYMPLAAAHELMHTLGFYHDERGMLRPSVGDPEILEEDLAVIRALYCGH